MNRTSPTIDLFTLIGMMATIAGIFLCLFFLFTPTTFGAPAIDVLQEDAGDGGHHADQRKQIYGWGRSVHASSDQLLCPAHAALVSKDRSVAH